MSKNKIKGGKAFGLLRQKKSKEKKSERHFGCNQLTADQEENPNTQKMLKIKIKRDPAC